MQKHQTEEMIMVKAAHLLFTRCFAGMQSLACFPINKQLMRSSQPTNLAPQHRLFPPLH
ncbi:hypothetical protein OIU74_008052 [Salix koriyanagi]|uniref:Uncharacterized protein n=1 Tax=Salix koriyanagi TaxID=2511006 RepID=A0A9Q0U561_9ROSI|nr:hypothetical protein OIU74_008052 [Salix koriyanagi]